MSNTLTGRVWVCDTAFTTASTDRCFVSRMQWNPTTQGHNLIIKDKNGKVLWTSTALGSVDLVGPEIWENPDPRLNYFDGFDVDTIDGGTVYVYFV